MNTDSSRVDVKNIDEAEDMRTGAGLAPSLQQNGQTFIVSLLFHSETISSVFALCQY